MEPFKNKRSVLDSGFVKKIKKIEKKRNFAFSGQ